jgi:molybdenum cofactor synthesis domain-containing protein
MIKTGILTVSDKGSRGERYDGSGDVIREMVAAAMLGEVVRYEIVPDEQVAITAILTQWADSGDVDLILTTGGTGLSQRDVTPEATLAVIEKVAPGFGEAMRAKSLEKTPMAVLSRATAGVRGRTLIINLPGSPKAVRECLEVVAPAIPHGIDIIKGTFTEHAVQEGGGG